MANFSYAEVVAEKLVVEKFVPTAFGIKSRTIDVKDAEAVIQSIKDFQKNDAKAIISHLEILTCTSSYPLPKSTLTRHPESEHIYLATQRHETIVTELKKHFKTSIIGEAKVCGPSFDRKDLNDRFVTPESGQFYQDRFKELSQDEELEKSLKEIALTNLSDVQERFSSPFLAKYRSFQGIRIRVFVLDEKKEIIPIKDEFKSPSSKSQ